MSKIFAPPKIPAAPAPIAPAPVTEAPTATTFTAAPTRAAAEVQAEITSSRMQRAAMRGRSRTLLADIDQVQPSRQKTLLGQ